MLSSYCKLLGESLTRTLSRVEGQLVDSEAPVAGLPLQVDPEVPRHVHRHLARLPLRAGCVKGPGTEVPQLGREGGSGQMCCLRQLSYGRRWGLWVPRTVSLWHKRAGVSNTSVLIS